MLEPGERIDDLIVDALLGTGSAAAIYRVRHAKDGTLAALKVAHSIDPTIRTRMLSEGTVLQQIEHSNVMTVYRAMTVGKRPALLMELIEGPTLAAWLDATALPAIADALELFKGIARGVQAAHYRGLIHRDLNPSNILLSVREDNQLLPKIVDFGLARPLERVAGGPTLQGPLGTVSYMAPEQMDDARRADKRSDLFALGCILYEICTGGRAFGGTLFEVHRKSHAGEYVQAAERRPDMAPEVSAIIDKLLRPDPDERFQTVQELMEALYDEGPPPMATEEVSGVFRAWSLGEVTLEAHDLAKSLSPRTDEADGVDDMLERTARRKRMELAGVAGLVIAGLAALAGTVALLARWL